MPQFLPLNSVLQSSGFKAHLFALNKICADVSHHYGVSSEDSFKIEGGLMYQHVQEYRVTDGPDPRRTQKLTNFLLACSSAKRMLEIGSNAGHSVLLALSANPELVVYSNDIFHHHYTERCLSYLKGVFGNRLHVLPGDSREVVPLLATHHSLQFDLLHVDGGHGESLCRTDIANCLRIAGRRSMMLVDDTSADHIRAVCAEFVDRGYLREETLGGKFRPDDQMFFHVRPSTRSFLRAFAG
jgi:predicted O-methyltransferase YrrM